MEDTEILNLWKVYDKKLEENLSLNKKNAEDITKIKLHSHLLSMKPMKIFTIIVGILWVVFVDILIVIAFKFGVSFFLISAIIQVLLTKLAIGVYVYQLILINRVDISDSILATQEKIARLKSSTIWVTKLLFLQFPVWNTFYWTQAVWENGGIWWYVIQIPLTAAFTYLAIWLFVNIRYENRNKKWFGLIFRGKEWTPLMKSMEILEQIEEYKRK
ncbi:hypothetical protein [Emticicia agri]|uniref:Uncharacterized protein n=1 Tax=Emticicia agri TaxID=2492393 RepID=A0A4Q5LXY8_9BACT|nr:hypothetical protein [Emticicia agri]RYU94427.1 hypothetical protein EWM59_16645 [Emticicia agri]